MKLLKRLTSIILTVAMIATLTVVPAGAADPFTVAVSSVTADAGASEVNLDISVANNPGFTAMSVRVYYKADVLTCTKVNVKKDSAGVSTAWNDFTEEEEGMFTGNPNDTQSCSTERTANGWKLASLGYVSTSAFRANGNIARLVFTIVGDAESCKSAIEVEVASCTAADGKTDVDLSTIKTVNGTITVNGVAPVLDYIELLENGKVYATGKNDNSNAGEIFLLDGKTSHTFKAKAYSTKGTDITGQVKWNLPYKFEGVTMTQSGGDVTIDVDKAAQVGMTQVTATDANNAKLVRRASIRHQRESIVPTSVTIEWMDSGDLLVPIGDETTTATFKSTVKDQFGDVIDKTKSEAMVDWKVTGPDGTISTNYVKFTQASGVTGTLIVTADAKDHIGTYVVSAISKYGDHVSADKTISVTVKRAAAEAKTIVISGADAVTIPTGDTATTESYTAAVKDQYDSPMADQNVELSVLQAAGVSMNNGVLTVDKTAQASNVTITAKVKDTDVTASKIVKLQSVEFTQTAAPTVKGNPTYGDTWSAIVTSIGSYSAKVGDTVIEGTYSLKDATACPDAGEQTYTILFNSTNGTYKNIVVATGEVTVQPYTLTVTKGDIDVSKTYDGTTAVTADKVTGKLGYTNPSFGDELSITYTSAAYNDANVADASKVMFSGLKLEGAKAANYKLNVASFDVDATITKAPLTIKAKDNTITYGDAPAENGFTVVSGLCGNDTDGVVTNVTYTYDYTQNGNVGSYTITPAGGEAANYEVKTYENGTLTVSPKALTVTAGNLKITKIYDGTNNAGVAAENTKLGLEGVVNNDNVQVSYTTIGAYADANVGSGKAVTISGLSLTGAKEGNYTISATEQQITAGEITKADLTAAMLSFAPASTVYDGTAKTVSVTLNAPYTGMGGVTVKYDGAASATDAKTYAVKVNVDEGSNFKAAAGLSLGEFTIQPKSIAGVTIEGIEANGYEFTGSEIKPAITVKDGDKTLRADTDYTVTYTGNTNVGTATLTVAGKGNYDSATTKQATFKITKTQPKIGTDYRVTIPTTNLIYSGTLKEATVEKTNTNIGSITVKYNGSTVKPVNAGTYAVTVDITESANYAAMTAVACGSFTIAKKDITVSGVTLQDKTYNGKTDDAVVTEVTFNGLVNSETLTLGTDFTATAAYDNANASDNAAAKATVTLKDSVKANNYNLTSGADLAATGKVEKATTTLSLSAANAVYTGTAYDENKIAKTSNVETAPTYTYYTDEGCTAAVAGGKPVGVGTYWVKGVIAETTNNTAAEAKDEFQITKAQLTIKANDNTITYGDEPANNGVTYTGLVNNESAETVVSGLTYEYNYTQYGNVGDYTITPKDATAANYEIKFVSGKLTVEQKEVGLTWKNGDLPLGEGKLYYDGKAKNVTATATGLVNEDEVTVTVAGGKQTAIGSYSAAATGLTGAKAGNYKLPADNTKAYKIEAALTSVTVDPATITATIDGLTIKLVGYKNADADITISAVNATVDGDKLTVNGVEYTIDDSAVVVKSAEVNVKPSETETAKADGADDTITNDVLDEINAGGTKGEGLEKAAASLIESISEGKPEGTSSIEVTFVLKIQPKTYKDGKLTLVIEPYVKRVFKDANDEVIGGEQETKISNSELKSLITVSVKLPGGMATTNLFAKHALGNGKFEYLTVTVANGVATWQQSSFSEVTLVSDTRTATITFQKDDGSTITKIYTAANLGEALPTDSRAGHTFSGWTVGGKTYKTLTDEALTAMAALAGGARTLTASFTQNGGGSIGGGGGAATYPVSVDKAENGSVTVSPKSAAKGGTVTIEVKPDEGYELASVTVLDKDGKKLDVTLKNGKYSFVMPDGKVSIKAEFAKKGAMSFADVAANSWYYDAVKYCFDNGLMNGVGEDKFAPSATTTRAMIWTVLARDAGVDTSTGATWYEAGMKWAMENKISDGTGAENAITREQFATMLYRVAQSKGEGFTDSWYFPLSFDDAASISDWADEAMHWCVMKGILNGSNNKLNPTDNASRAEVAAMLMRFLTLDK